VARLRLLCVRGRKLVAVRGARVRPARRELAWYYLDTAAVTGAHAKAPRLRGGVPFARYRLARHRAGPLVPMSSPSVADITGSASSGLERSGDRARRGPRGSCGRDVPFEGCSCPDIPRTASIECHTFESAGVRCQVSERKPQVDRHFRGGGDQGFTCAIGAVERASCLQLCAHLSITRCPIGCGCFFTDADSIGACS
jgi:hypothetical protein